MLGGPVLEKGGVVRVRRFGKQGKEPAHKEPELGQPLQTRMTGVVRWGQGWPDQVGGEEGWRGEWSG